MGLSKLGSNSLGFSKPSRVHSVAATLARPGVFIGAKVNFLSRPLPTMAQGTGLSVCDVLGTFWPFLISNMISALP